VLLWIADAAKHAKSRGENVGLRVCGCSFGCGRVVDEG
jgi:hypothetical protein